MIPLTATNRLDSSCLSSSSWSTSTDDKHTSSGEVAHFSLLQLLRSLSKSEFLLLQNNFGENGEKKLSYSTFASLCIDAVVLKYPQLHEKDFTDEADRLCQAVGRRQGYIGWAEFCSFLADTCTSSCTDVSASTILKYDYLGAFQVRICRDDKVRPMVYFPALHCAAAVMGKTVGLLAVHGKCCNVEQRLSLPSVILSTDYCAPHEILLFSLADRRLWAYHCAYVPGADRTGDIELLGEYRLDAPQTVVKFGPTSGRLYSGTQEGEVLISEFSLCERNESNNLARHRVGTSSSQCSLQFHVHRHWRSVHQDAIKDLLVLRDERRLITCSLDGKVIELDLEMNLPVVHKGHGSGVHSLAYNEDLRLIFSAGFEYHINAWELTHPKISPMPLHDYVSPHHSTILGVVSVPKSFQLISVDIEGMVKVWDLRMFKCVHRFWADPGTGHKRPGRQSGSFSSFTYFPDKGMICCNGSHRSHLHEYEGAAILHEPEKLCKQEEVISAFDIHLPSQLLILAVGHGLKVFDLRLGILQYFCPSVSPEEISCICITEDGTSLFVGTLKGHIALVKVEDGSMLYVQQPQEERILFIALVGSSTRKLLVGSSHGSLWLWPHAHSFQHERPSCVVPMDHHICSYCVCNGLGYLFLLDSAASWAAISLEEMYMVDIYQECHADKGTELIAIQSLNPYSAICFSDGSGKLYIHSLHSYLYGHRVLAVWENSHGSPAIPAPKISNPYDAITIAPVVTCMAFSVLCNAPCLITGDETGWICIWEMNDLLQTANLQQDAKQQKKLPCPALCHSRDILESWQAHCEPLLFLRTLDTSKALLSCGLDGHIVFWAIGENGSHRKLGSLQQCGTGHPWQNPLLRPNLPPEPICVGRADQVCRTLRQMRSEEEDNADSPGAFDKLSTAFSYRCLSNVSTEVSTPHCLPEATVTHVGTDSSSSPSPQQSSVDTAVYPELAVPMPHFNHRIVSTWNVSHSEPQPWVTRAVVSPTRKPKPSQVRKAKVLFATRVLRHRNPRDGSTIYAHVNPMTWNHSHPTIIGNTNEGPLPPAPFADPRAVRLPVGSGRTIMVPVSAEHSTLNQCGLTGCIEGPLPHKAPEIATDADNGDRATTTLDEQRTSPSAEVTSDALLTASPSHDSDTLPQTDSMPCPQHIPENPDSHPEDIDLQDPNSWPLQVSDLDHRPSEMDSPETDFLLNEVHRTADDGLSCVTSEPFRDDEPSSLCSDSLVLLLQSYRLTAPSNEGRSGAVSPSKIRPSHDSPSVAIKDIDGTAEDILHPRSKQMRHRHLIRKQALKSLTTPPPTFPDPTPSIQFGTSLPGSCTVVHPAKVDRNVSSHPAAPAFRPTLHLTIHNTNYAIVAPPPAKARCAATTDRESQKHNKDEPQISTDPGVDLNVRSVPSVPALPDADEPMHAIDTEVDGSEHEEHQERPEFGQPITLVTDTVEATPAQHEEAQRLDDNMSRNSCATASDEIEGAAQPATTLCNAPESDNKKLAVYFADMFAEEPSPGMDLMKMIPSLNYAQRQSDARASDVPSQRSPSSFVRVYPRQSSNRTPLTATPQLLSLTHKEASMQRGLTGSINAPSPYFGLNPRSGSFSRKSKVVATHLMSASMIGGKGAGQGAASQASQASQAAYGFPARCIAGPGVASKANALCKRKAFLQQNNVRPPSPSAPQEEKQDKP